MIKSMYTYPDDVFTDSDYRRFRINRVCLPRETALPKQEETMASNFTNFLVSLGDDPQQLETLKQDPDAVLDVAGLTPAEKSLIKSGDVQLIRSALVSDSGLKETFGVDPNLSLSTKISLFIHIFVAAPHSSGSAST